MSTPAYSANIRVRSFILPAYNSIHISDIHFKSYNIKCFLQKSIRAYWSKLRVQTNSFFQNNPNSFRDYHYMVLPQTFLYRISAMQSFKSYKCFRVVFMEKHRATYPLIIAKESSLEKNEAPGRTVTVSLPALIRSASSSPFLGNGPWTQRHEQRVSLPSGLEYQIQLLVVKSSECGFESRSWHVCPWARYFTIIASLHPGV